MKKTGIIIVLIVILIVIAGIVLFLVLREKPDKCGDGVCEGSETKTDCLQDCNTSENDGNGDNGGGSGTPYCGDGTCGDYETNITCPQDCEEPTLSYKESPFGLQAPYPEDSHLTIFGETSLLTDVGIKWVRLQARELESVSAQLSENDINILSGIAPARYPSDMETYLQGVRTTVRKYKDYVDAWLIVNEADNSWKDLPREYVEYFTLTSEVIKSEDPDSIIVLSLAGGQIVNGTFNSTKGINFLNLTLKNGIAPYFDVLDFHVQGEGGDYKYLTLKTSAFRDVLSENGVERPIWITEYGTHDGDPTPDNPIQPDYPYQSEKVQASELLKKYAYGISLNVDKMFWTTMVEWYNYNNNTNSYFSNVGLVNNPKTDGKNHKKLAYHTYKKMTEILEGSDWDNIQTTQESYDIYIYKLIKNGKQTWIAWNDGTERQITISNVNSNSVKITEAVPKYSTGQEVTDYTTAFNTVIKTVNNRQVTLTLREVPVFVEEI